MSRKARGLRPLRPRRFCAGRRRARAAGRRLSRSVRYFPRSLRRQRRRRRRRGVEYLRAVFWRRRGRRATADRDGKQRGSDLRYDMQIRLEEAAFGCDKEIEVSKLEGCGRLPGHRRRGRLASAVTCRDCGGRGQVISSRGFFQVSQTCPRCRGTGQVIEKPVPQVRRRRPRRSSPRGSS